MAGDPWRHVGVASIVDGEMSACEVAGHRFQFRPLRSIVVPPHTAVGVARFSSDRARCAKAAADWVTRMLSEKNLYAWDDLILAGVLLMVRRRTPPVLFDDVIAVVRAAERLAREMPPPEHQRSFTCASFAYHAFAQAGLECQPEVKIEPVRTRPGRFRDQAIGIPPALAELVLEAELGDPERLVEPLLHYSLLELSGVVPQPDGPRIRSSSTSRMNADQFVATARNLIRIFANVKTTELPARLVVDERWVSPGDLWRLDSIAFRALLPIAVA